MCVESKYKCCYAARSTNAVLWPESSSGGIFVELARWTVLRGGSVFGCVWTNDLNVEYTMAKTLDEVLPMRGSKYVSARMNGVFKSVQAELDMGAWALFVGTPCQIMGLKKYLMRDYEKLLAVELICHGVPTDSFFQKFKREEEERANSKLVSINFRDKSHGWHQSYLTLRFVDSTKDYSLPLYESAFGRAFLSRLPMRIDCLNCKCRKGVSGADITIGDYWGVEEFHPEFNDDNGVSAVIVRTEKGEVVFRDLSVESVASKFESIVCHNPNLLPLDVTALLPARKRFFRALERHSIVEAYAIAFRPAPLFVRAIRKIVRCVKAFSR